MHQPRLLAVGGASLAIAFLLALTDGAEAFPLSGAAWSEAQWEQHCKEVRTSYNPRSQPIGSR